MARGQHFRPAAAGRARGTGSDEAPVEPGKEPCDLGLAAGLHARPEVLADKVEHRARRRPAGCGFGLSGDQAPRQDLQPLDGIALAPPGPIRNLQRRWPRSGPGLGHVAVQGIEAFRHAQILGQGPDQGSPAARAIAPGQAAERHQQIGSLAALG